VVLSKDRRKFIRYDIPLDVEFKLLDDKSEYYSGVTTNFSRSGLCFETSHNTAQLNKALDIKIRVPDSNKFTSAVGDLVWIQDLDDKYLYGIKLMVMETDAKSIVLDSAYKIWLDTMRG
jgi:c-di-GMP-binding flagellar brake protein YcgR